MLPAVTRPVRNRFRIYLIGLVVLLAALRLAHIRLLWADEDYHLAAALQVLHGKAPYRDFWYDKPPLNALFYILAGAAPGWPLRLLDSAYVLLVCVLCFLVARRWWSEAEGWVAALLMAFFMAFYLPSAVISLAADALMLAPHLAAIYFAVTKRPFLAGACCALASLFNPKALFVAATLALWLPGDLLALASGFLLPVAAAAFIAVLSGIWPGYVEQVWRWGLIYATGSPVSHPAAVGLRRTADWLGFHSVLLLGTILALRKAGSNDRFRLAVWIACSFAAVCLGARWAPHYFLQLLPVMVIAGARGLVAAWSEERRWLPWVAAIMLAIPLVRFGPRYVSLTIDNLLGRAPAWSDVTLDSDSRQAAAEIRTMAHPGNTLFVWGYRPDIYVYSRLASDGLFWDSQPLTGVPADRHLSATTVIYGGEAARNRAAFAQSRPDFFVDGLSPINPRLAPARYPELERWLAEYRLWKKTKLCLIYRRVGR